MKITWKQRRKNWRAAMFDLTGRVRIEKPMCIYREVVANDMGKMERLMKLRFFCRTCNKNEFYVVLMY